MLLYSAATVSGFALLIWGADRFVVGAAGTARNLGVPTILIGLTVVALATSAPEILVSITASLDVPRLPDLRLTTNTIHISI